MSAIDLILRYGRQGVPPTFQRDFAGVKTLDHGTGPAITFTRASNATFFDANGVLQTAANDTPRFDHDPATGASRGLLIEESRTNSLRNSQAGGAVVGTHAGGSGDGGVLPTNWIWTSGGLDLDVVGTGIENGFNYIEIRFYGTTTSSAAALGYEAQNHIVAANGQTWTGSHYVRTVAGDLTNITQVSTQVRVNNFSTSVGSTTVAFTPSASYQRATSTITIADATANRVVGRLAFSFSSGVAIDITLRIAAPQLEQGAFATSYIPTTTAAATRAADSAIVTPVSSFYNEAEGTLFADSTAFAANNSRILAFSDNTTSNRVTINRGSGSGGNINLNVTSGGAAQTSPLLLGSSLSGNTAISVAAVYRAADFAGSFNGNTVITQTSGSVPAGISQLTIGNGEAAGNNTYSGHIRKVAYWPKRLTNTLLEQLSTT